MAYRLRPRARAPSGPLWLARSRGGSRDHPCTFCRACPLRNDQVRPTGEQSFERAAPGIEQTVSMSPLGHTLALRSELRNRIAFEHGDGLEVIREGTRRDDAAENDRLISESCHGFLPCCRGKLWRSRYSDGRTPAEGAALADRGRDTGGHHGFPARIAVRHASAWSAWRCRPFSTRARKQKRARGRSRDIARIVRAPDARARTGLRSLARRSCNDSFFRFGAEHQLDYRGGELESQRSSSARAAGALSELRIEENRGTKGCRFTRDLSQANQERIMQLSRKDF